jgi:hypothetical protein
MGSSTSTSPSRRRAMALSAAITMCMFFGMTSMAAQATNTVSVEATVTFCEVLLVTPAQGIVLEPAGETDDGDYLFETSGMDVIEVGWGVSGDGECLGSLYIERSPIVIDGGSEEVDGSSFYYSYGSDQVLAVGTPVFLTDDPTGYSEIIYANMTIPKDAGRGTFSTVLTFTIVVD